MHMSNPIINYTVSLAGLAPLGCLLTTFALMSLAWSAFGPLVVQSTDGDFLPLALVHCEAHADRHVFLDRIETRISADAKGTTLGASKRRMEFVWMCEPCHAFAVLVALTGCDLEIKMRSTSEKSTNTMVERTIQTRW
jgi:hypothetical protein